MIADLTVLDRLLPHQITDSIVVEWMSRSMVRVLIIDHAGGRLRCYRHSFRSDRLMHAGVAGDDRDRLMHVLIK